MSMTFSNADNPSAREVRFVWLAILLVILAANHVFGQTKRPRSTFKTAYSQSHRATTKVVQNQTKRRTR